jgi:hypothetical protein
MGLTNIGFIERPGSTGCHYLRECVLGRRLVSMVMDPDRPTGRCKGQADRSPNPSGCTGHKHRMFLVDLVHLVCLVHLVGLVCFVCLVDLVHLVSFVQPNKQDKPNKPNNGPIMGGISHEGKPAAAM